MLVRMLTHISGGHDGVPWPPAGETIEVPDAEGASLIRAEIAVAAGKDAKAVMDSLAEQPTPGHPSKLDYRPPSQAEGEKLAAEAAAEQEQQEPAAEEAAPEEPSGELPSLAQDEAGQDEAGGDGNAARDAAESSSVAGAPGPSAPKQAWIDYAVQAHGADVHAAGSMTKADLMSRYGGRL